MLSKRSVAMALMVPVLATVLTFGVTPRPARADDNWAWLLGGLVLGALIGSDGGHNYYAPRPARAYYYPGPRVYAYPPGLTSYPAGCRYWRFAGYNWRGRPVYVPVRNWRAEGPRTAVMFREGNGGPVFRFDGRLDKDRDKDRPHKAVVSRKHR